MVTGREWEGLGQLPQRARVRVGEGRGTDTVPVAMDLPREKVLDLIPHATERETNFIRETGAGGDE